MIRKSFVALLALLAGAATTATATELATTPVERVEVPRVYRLDGVVEAVSQSTVSAQTSGQVAEVLFDVEDYVDKGDLLLVLKDTEQRARVDQAEANLRAAGARLRDARQELERIEGVHARQLVSQQELDKARAALDTASAQHEAAAAALEQAREQLGYTRVRAPYKGIVTRRLVELGEVAQVGTPLMTGISLERLRVVVDVPQSVVPQVRDYAEAQVRTPGGGWIDAERITVFPFADQASNTFKVRLDLPADVAGLFPGMYIKAAFVTGAREALVVPEESVVFRSEVTGVYVVDDEGRVSLRHVRVGRPLGDGRVAVLAGLSEGERVALDTIAAGVLLKDQRATAPAEDHG
ncbi:MAG: efflux RND transporter periplasmic adaptor subunit [Gammaproteobacteria bacterium]